MAGKTQRRARFIIIVTSSLAQCGFYGSSWLRRRALGPRHVIDFQSANSVNEFNSKEGASVG